MQYFYHCSCMFNRHKIVADELKDHYELNDGIQTSELLKYLEPYKHTHPVAALHYENLSTHYPVQTPRMVIQNEQAYKWLVEFHERLGS